MKLNIEYKPLEIIRDKLHPNLTVTQSARKVLQELVDEIINTQVPVEDNYKEVTNDKNNESSN
jgi:hypothetical protein